MEPLLRPSTLALLACLLAGPAWAQRVALSPEELYERVAPSIWLVENARAGGEGAIGSAVVVAPATLVTNCHVVEKAQSLSVVHGQKRYMARLQYRDPVRDLCQLQAPGVEAPAVRIGATAALRVGAKVYAVGNPRGLELTLSDGLVSGLRRNRAGQLEYVQISVPISPGSSGGGLFDVFGRLVGITTSGLKESQNLNFALPAEWIVELPGRAAGEPAMVGIEPAEPPAAVAAAKPTTAPAAPPAPTPAPAPALPVAPIAPASPPAVVAVVPASPRIETDRLAATLGKVFTYRLRDRINHADRLLTLQVDRLEGDRVVFNGGTRVETRQGEVLHLAAPQAGEADAAMPPGGWLRPGAASGSRWHVKVATRSIQSELELDVDAVAADEVILQVAGQGVRALRVVFSGYTRRGTSIGRPPSGPYRATAWFADGRLLRFEARARGGVGGDAFLLDEVLELVDVR